MSKNIGAKKKLLGLALIILILFLLINMFWIVTMFVPYYGYMSKVDSEETECGMIYEKEHDGYKFKVSPTPYLGYDAFLSVSKKHSVYMDSEGNIISADNNITLFIWPNIWTGNEYGIMFLNEFNDTFIQVMIDENGEFIPYNTNDNSFNQEVEIYISENKSEISKLIRLAKNMWGLKSVNDMKAGIISCVQDKMILLYVCLTAVAFVIVFKVFLWCFRFRIPFEQYTNEMNFGINKTFPIFKKFPFNKTTKGYMFFAKCPTFCRKNGVLAICKKNCTVKDVGNFLQVLIYPQKENFVEVYAGNKKISTLELNLNYRENLENSFLKDTQKEEIIELIDVAKGFWSIE